MNFTTDRITTTTHLPYWFWVIIRIYYAIMCFDQMLVCYHQILLISVLWSNACMLSSNISNEWNIMCFDQMLVCYHQILLISVLWSNACMLSSNISNEWNIMCCDKMLVCYLPILPMSHTSCVEQMLLCHFKIYD